MMDQRRQQLIEQYEDAALSLLMDEYANEEGERLLKEFEEAKKNGDLPEMPAELDAKCRKLIDQTFAKQERKVRLKRIGRSAARVAVVAFVLLGALSTMVVSVEALRVPILNFYIQLSKEYSTLVGNDSIEMQPQVETIDQVLDAMLPDSYQLVSQDISQNGICTLYYQNSNGAIIVFDVSPYSGAANIDTEDADYSKIELYNHEAFVLIKDGYRVIWINTTTNHVCDFYANGLDLDIFWDIVYVLAEQEY